MALGAAKDLPTVDLARATKLLVLMASERSPLYPRAAARWLTRYTTEARDLTPAALADVAEALKYLIGLAGNSGYASLVSIFASGVFVVASVTSHTVLIWFSPLGLALMAHLAVALLLVMQRIFSLTQERLLSARTGAEQPPRERRMTVVNDGDHDEPRSELG
jgi:hypothetical protein